MADKRRKPELLAPAGDMERLEMALRYGADAVYLAGQSYGMRAFAGNFTDEELRAAVPLPTAGASGSTAPSTPCPATMRSSSFRPIWSC